MTMKHLLQLFALIFLVPFGLSAQKTTIVQHYPKDTTGMAAGKIIPARTEEHRIIINYYDNNSKFLVYDHNSRGQLFCNLPAKINDVI
jgi:hypothetical protein